LGKEGPAKTGVLEELVAFLKFCIEDKPYSTEVRGKNKKKGMNIMNKYFVAYEPDLRCYPNYSFEIGDIDGDGRKEMISLNQNGDRLRVVNLDGDVILEQRIVNDGNWGTPIICVMDIDNDGREEIIVPSYEKRREARVIALNAEGKVIREHSFGTYTKDDYGIGVPLLAPIRFQGDQVGFVAAIAGGHVAALDSDFREVWRIGGFRKDFAHEFYIADIDNDGLDEIAFCTINHINAEPTGHKGDDFNVGELVLLDHDGKILLRRRTDQYCHDAHFDDVAMADFRGMGQPEILLEKGILINLDGSVIWDVSNEFDHGQWIAHTPNPNGKGKVIFISELWGAKGKSALFSSDGKKLMTIDSLPRTRLDQKKFPGGKVLPTRCHIIHWTKESDPEIFVAEQAHGPTAHNCFSTVSFELKAFLLDLKGNLLGTMPFKDTRIEGYWYNGEVPSRVADVDNDGQQEVVFPRQDGHVMIIKKDISA